MDQAILEQIGIGLLEYASAVAILFVSIVFFIKSLIGKIWL